MIVNSSQGGGSKDTWVLEEDAEPRRRRAAPLRRWSPPRMPGLRSAAPGPPSSSNNSSSPMLARIAHELYWIGRQLARAEHTARMLDGVFHADLQGRPDDPAGVRLSWDALLTIVRGEPPETPAVARRGAARC